MLALPALPVTAQSLQQAVLLGTSRDPTIAAFRQDVARETSNIEIEKDARRPQFSIGSNIGGGNNSFGAEITASQLLFDWGVSKGQINAATAIRVQSVADLKMKVEDLTLEISELYFDIKSIRRKIQTTGDYIVFTRRIAKQSDERVRAGLASKSETARARLDITRAEQDLFQLRSDRENALAELEFILGQRPASPVPPPPQLAFVQRLSSSKMVIAAVTNAPDYVRARAAVEIAGAEVKVARAQRKPTIQLEAVGRQDLTGGRGSSGAVGLSAGVNLSSSTFRGRQVTAALQGLKASESRLRGIERDLQNEARFFRQNLRALESSQQSLRAQVEAARSVLDSYEQQFVVGQRELVDLLTTGRDLYEAQLEEIDVTDELEKTEYQAAHSVGLLGALLLGVSSN